MHQRRGVRFRQQLHHSLPGASAPSVTRTSLTQERSEVQGARTGEEVGAPVIVSEHGEHVLDAAAGRVRIRLLALLLLLGSSAPAQPSARAQNASPYPERMIDGLDERECEMLG